MNSDMAEWSPPAKALAGVVFLALLAALWSVIASTVFLAGTRMLMKHHGVPYAEFWSYYRYYGFSHRIVGGWLKIAAGVATAIPLLFFVIRVIRKGMPGSTSKALHGSTRWASRSELVRNDLYAKFAGLYVGRDAQGRYLRFGGPEHVACYAPTRSGKGVGLVIPNALLYEASLVCLDVKKENWAATAGIRAAAGQKVFLFDPLAPDGRTARYNPFTYVRRDTIDAFEDIQRIAQMVFPHVSGDQAFWTDSARSAFTGAAGFLAETPELPLTFGEVLRLLSSVDGAASMLQRIEARRQQGKPYTEATVKALEDYLKGSADLVNSIRKTITSKLSLWFNPRIDAATAESDFDLRELRSSLHAIYVGITPDNIARLRPLLALFFQQLVDLTIRTLPQFDPAAKHQVLLLLDEFPL
ncbi:MAG: type IV secretory system conjugative DNA transfer family protein, partial [Janthinobacterium lividum]